ncbi:hypothetical protein JB92DRAFT_2840534 [Gautieria morchelliformis]|nr:hypothetical protein JB92DRAFT_2840534 [Gautieria morchelliformis]
MQVKSKPSCRRTRKVSRYWLLECSRNAPKQASRANLRPRLVPQKVHLPSPQPAGSRQISFSAPRR